MRILKICAVVLLVAALSEAAWAVTPPPYWSPVNQLKSRNQDNGTTYAVTDPVAFAAAGGFGTTFDPDNLAGTGISRTKPTGAVAQPGNPNELEDSWGIIHVYFIKAGTLTGNQTQVNGIPAAPTWDNSDGLEDTWLVGIFYGGNDTGITFTNPLNATALTISTEGLHFELWAVDRAALSASATLNGVGPIDPENLVDFDAANRSAANRYDGWVDGVGIKLLTGVSTEQTFSGTISADGLTFDGQTDAYFDIDATDPTGLWNAAWGSDPQLLSLVNSVLSDAYFSWDVQNSSRDWDVASTDLGGVANVIPEPLTMIGLVLGIGSVGGYLRRRTRIG